MLKQFLLASRMLTSAAIVFAIFYPTSAIAQQQRQQPRPADRRYEDASTFKNGKPFIADPYVWAYTREFAEMFRMPDKWIDEDLKGALAVAFRMSTTGFMTCGLGGKEENCWPPLYCQIDLYYDNKTTLPWVRQDIVRDFMMPGASSADHLVRSHPGMVQRYVPVPDPDAPRGVIPQLSLVWSIPPTTSGNLWTITYYDKEFQPTVGLIGFYGLCPTVPAKAYMRFYDLETTARAARMQIQLKDATATHVVELPQAFMKRANEKYKQLNKPNEEVIQRQLRQFFGK
jgi:hypothetical protein